jgi:alkylation response protein AidB-like acyl-CoA dehydrogenase
VPGHLSLHEAEVGDGRWPVAIGEADAARARARSVFLGRVAIGLEVLGAAEGALALAVEHARAREQFGQPIAAFQAVRHLLAWATSDCTAVERVVTEAVVLDAAAPSKYGDITKALAGRNGRRVCERALQVLGAIGFTAEHGHHHFHSRVLALDALLGTSAALTRELGAWRRQEPGDPRISATLLLAR